MEFVTFKKAWGLSLRENLLKNVIIILLALALVVTSWGWFRSHETVVLVPPLLDERVSIARDEASASYKKKWAHFVAQLVGNIHPGNVDFVIDALQGILSPKAYSDIKAVLAEQVSDIKSDSLTVSFEPRQVLYEEDTGKAFVAGDFVAGGPSGDPTRFYRTYEITVAARFGQPWVDGFAVYSGQPKTVAVLTQEAAAEGGSK